MATRPHFVRRLYDWVLSWAHHPHGTRALFGISFAESSFFPIPPDPLLLALGLARRDRAMFFALVTSVASVLGGLFGYFLGATVWEGIQGFCFDFIPGLTPERFEAFEESYKANGFLIVFLAGFTPIPYKVITISSGALGMNVGLFVLASIVGRSARFFLVAWLVKRFGKPMKEFIERHFDWVAVGFAVLLIGGILILKYVH